MTLRPALFVSHGSPMIALDDARGPDPWGRALADFAARSPRPRAVVVVSGHFETSGPVRVTSSPAPATIHDFSGFPDELSRIEYPVKGDPGLAAMIVRLLGEAGFAARADAERGLDHGAWVPLRFLYPAADVPVVEISQPLRRSPEEGLRMGAALSRLRDENVVLLGTGGIVHNLSALDMSAAPGQAADWARVFDSWIADHLSAMDIAGIASYRTTAPHAERAVPTPEHFDPIFVVLGSTRSGERATTIYEGFRYGTLSLRSFALG